jgi:hypothetical protein
MTGAPVYVASSHNVAFMHEGSFVEMGETAGTSAIPNLTLSGPPASIPNLTLALT